MSHVGTREMLLKVIYVNSQGVRFRISQAVPEIKGTEAKKKKKSPWKFTSLPCVASSVPRPRIHTHTLETHAADNRQTLGSKRITTKDPIFDKMRQLEIFREDERLITFLTFSWLFTIKMAAL